MRDFEIFNNQLHSSEINKLDDYYRIPEGDALQTLIDHTDFYQKNQLAIEKCAAELVAKVRSKHIGKGSLDAFLLEYGLDTNEGVALMCLAEALLRIPDKKTRDALIEDKIGGAKWGEHSGKSSSLFVNAATWGLMLTGKVVKLGTYSDNNMSKAVKSLRSKTSDPIIRQAVKTAMKILGREFVLGTDIKEAFERAKKCEAEGYTYSYDMLGEAARTDADAEYYYNAYKNAIIELAKIANKSDPNENPGISIKLSALDPRYEYSQFKRVKEKLYPRLKELALMAKNADIGFTIDAEETDRLTISFELLKDLSYEQELAGWNGLGLALQSYSKRSFYVIDFLADLARKSNRRFMLRLVKGAYWDAEIKISQVEGLKDFPLFTRKAATDVSYMACAHKILQNTDVFYPQFATHNAYTVAAILELAKSLNYYDFEFQRLHGMGDALYKQIINKNNNPNIHCRIYAPVGGYEHLLAYLVRRLLENGANSSFVNKLIDENVPVSKLVESPYEKVLSQKLTPNNQIRLPENLFKDRKNSMGVDLSNNNVREKLELDLNKILKDNSDSFIGHSIIDGKKVLSNDPKIKYNPANLSEKVGVIHQATADDANRAVESAYRAQIKWNKTDVNIRAACLEKFADKLEENKELFYTIAIKEAGKTLKNCVGEIREAIDFCRYYAAQARKDMAQAEVLPGPTGESNTLQLSGKGVFACISPWNFPLAIFTGQVVAAIVTGNAVVAKPAEQTSIIATLAVKLMHESGIPQDIMQLVVGRGSVVGNALALHPKVCGVVFTGSTETARMINMNLAQKEGPIATLIAETGGQNCMIVDSSALPEQVVRDTVMSAFDSAGQRCSALRVLYLQEEIADKFITMIKGAMDALVVDNPEKLSTDVGPVIDTAALSGLQEHVELMSKNNNAKILHKCQILAENGNFLAPHLIEINNINELKKEQFGPILHVIKYKSSELEQVIADINGTGFGLTFGIHSRISHYVDKIINNIHAGNCYVNRNTIGAIVGVQPFGGEGLSGTGPKAGGPRYLYRMCNEKTVSVDTTASGGNASLMSLTDE